MGEQRSLDSFIPSSDSAAHPYLEFFSLDEPKDYVEEETIESYDGAEDAIVGRVGRDVGSATGKISYPFYGARNVSARYMATTGKTTHTFRFGAPISLRDLKVMTDREPIAHNLIWRVADDIFKSWFQLVPATGKESEIPDPEVGNQFQQALLAINAKKEFYRAGGYARRDGWSVIAFLNDRDAPKGFVAEAFDVENIEIDWGDWKPRAYRLFRRVGDRGQTRVPVGNLDAKHVIHIVTNPGITPYFGKSELESIWDYLTIIRNTCYGMGQTIFRVGTGFPDITVKGRVDRDYLNKVKEQYKDLSGRTACIHDEDISIQFIGGAGTTLNPRDYHDPLVEHICAAKGIPKAILFGDASGAIATGEVNERGYYAIIEAEQHKWTPFILQMLEYVAKSIGYPWEMNPLKPQWLLRYALNELQQQVLEGSRVDSFAQAEISYLSRREVRREAGYPEVPADAMKDQPEDDAYYASKREQGIQFELEEEHVERPQAETGQRPSTIEQTVQGKEIEKLASPSRAGTHIHGEQHTDTLEDAEGTCPSGKQGKWVTVKGRKICIEEGETIESTLAQTKEQTKREETKAKELGKKVKTLKAVGQMTGEAGTVIHGEQEPTHEEHLARCIRSKREEGMSKEKAMSECQKQLRGDSISRDGIQRCRNYTVFASTQLDDMYVVDSEKKVGIYIYDDVALEHLELLKSKGVCGYIDWFLAQGYDARMNKYDYRRDSAQDYEAFLDCVKHYEDEGQSHEEANVTCARLMKNHDSGDLVQSEMNKCVRTYMEKGIPQEDAIEYCREGIPLDEALAYSGIKKSHDSIRKYAEDALREGVVSNLGQKLQFYRRQDPDFGEVIVFPNRVVAKEIVQFYQDENKHMYKPAGQLRRTTQFMKKFPPAVSWEHPRTDTLTNLKEPVGWTENPHFKDGRSIADIVYAREWLGDDRYQDLITGKKPDLSIGFFYDEVSDEGEFDGTPYQSSQHNIFVNHIATTKKGRCSTEEGCGLLSRYDSLTEGKQFAYDSVSLMREDATYIVPPEKGELGPGPSMTMPETFKSGAECVGWNMAHGLSREKAEEKCREKYGNGELPKQDVSPEVADVQKRALLGPREYKTEEEWLVVCRQYHDEAFCRHRWAQYQSQQHDVRDTIETTQENCVSKMIAHEKRAHPEMKQDQLVAVAYSKCREKYGEGAFPKKGDSITTDEPDQRPPKDWWDGCMSAMEDRYDNETARKVCGSLWFKKGETHPKIRSHTWGDSKAIWKAVDTIAFVDRIKQLIRKFTGDTEMDEQTELSLIARVIAELAKDQEGEEKEPSCVEKKMAEGMSKEEAEAACAPKEEKKGDSTEQDVSDEEYIAECVKAGHAEDECRKMLPRYRQTELLKVREKLEKLTFSDTREQDESTGPVEESGKRGSVRGDATDFEDVVSPEDAARFKKWIGLKLREGLSGGAAAYLFKDECLGKGYSDQTCDEFFDRVLPEGANIGFTDSQKRDESTGPVGEMRSGVEEAQMSPQEEARSEGKPLPTPAQPTSEVNPPPEEAETMEVCIKARMAKGESESEARAACQAESSDNRPQEHPEDTPSVALESKVADLEKRLKVILTKRQRDAEQLEEARNVLIAKILKDSYGIWKEDQLEKKDYCHLQAIDDVLESMRKRMKDAEEERIPRFPQVDEKDKETITEKPRVSGVGKKNQDTGEWEPVKNEF